MSLAWRNRQIIDYEPTGNEQAWSGEIGSVYDADYPGPSEDYFADSENRTAYGHGVSSIKDLVDYEIGGITGDTKYVGSTGVVDPSNVDAHYFDGGQAVIRRHPDTNYGPVRTSDHNSLLAILYAAQESNAFFPNEVSQVSMIRAV